MRRHKMPDAHADHPNVTPLIDVVMCLFIFYMLVAKIGVNTGQVTGGSARYCPSGWPDGGVRKLPDVSHALHDETDLHAASPTSEQTGIARWSRRRQPKECGQVDD